MTGWAVDDADADHILLPPDHSPDELLSLIRSHPYVFFYLLADTTLNSLESRHASLPYALLVSETLCSIPPWHVGRVLA